MLSQPTKDLTLARPDLLENSFRPIARKNGAIWLDSSLSSGRNGRRSFIARNPCIDVALTDRGVVVQKSGKPLEVRESSGVFDLLNRLWQEEGLFSAGYISYEATLPELDIKPNIENSAIPLVRFFFYDSYLSYDHLTNQITVSNRSRDAYDDLLYGADSSGRPVFPTPKALYSLENKAEYLKNVGTIKGYIREGDIYQANYTTRIEVESAVDPFDTYRQLRRLNPAPYAAYMNFGDYQILSSSPECMFTLSDRTIRTSPIKGTIAVGASQLETENNVQKLIDSEKDRAELLMIVDLERNDLGRIARCGTVMVENLFRPEVYSSVIHLVSDISAEIDNSVSMKEIINALLPGGSITGAPKRRAAEIIAELEKVPRQVYTGSIGYVCGRTADFNIAIRTILHQSGRYHINAGGGIVADSDPHAEYNEMLLKAKNMLRAVGVEPEGIR